MTFLQLFNLYVAFIEGSQVRHTDLVTPVIAYARSTGNSPTRVLENLQDSYFPL